MRRFLCLVALVVGLIVPTVAPAGAADSYIDTVITSTFGCEWTSHGSNVTDRATWTYNTGCGPGPLTWGQFCLSVTYYDGDDGQVKWGDTICKANATITIGMQLSAYFFDDGDNSYFGRRWNWTDLGYCRQDTIFSGITNC